MDDYYQTRLQFQAGSELLNLKIHCAEETRREDWLLRECSIHRVIYIHARPYLSEPQYILTMALYDQPKSDGAIGVVVEVKEGELLEREVGNAQAWVYIDDGVALLWECFFFTHERKETRQKALWQAFEQVLLSQGEIKEIYTPAWDPAFKDSEYEALLTSLVYQPVEGGRMRRKTL